MQGPKQHSKEWYELSNKCESIGCSQIGNLYVETEYLGFKKLADKFALIRRKLKPAFEGGAACGWGTVFETVVVWYITHRLGCTVYCRDVCITNIPEVPRLRCSPDGIMKVYRTKDDTLWTVAMDRSEKVKAECVLIEIKCPYSRWLGKTIPPHYIPQVQGGLIATKKITQRGLFIDACIKICTKDELGEKPGYNTTFHKDSKRMRLQDPVAWGEIQVLEARCSNREDDIEIDYGAENNEVITKMFDAISKRELFTSLGSIMFANNGGKMDFSQRDRERIGVICFKLMDIRYHTVEPSPGFCTELNDKIRKFFEKVDLLSYTGTENTPDKTEG